MMPKRGSNGCVPPEKQSPSPEASNDASFYLARGTQKLLRNCDGVTTQPHAMPVLPISVLRKIVRLSFLDFLHARPFVSQRDPLLTEQGFQFLVCFPENLRIIVLVIWKTLLVYNLPVIGPFPRIANYVVMVEKSISEKEVQ